MLPLAQDVDRYSPAWWYADVSEGAIIPLRKLDAVLPYLRQASQHWHPCCYSINNSCVSLIPVLLLSALTQASPLQIYQLIQPPVLLCLPWSCHWHDLGACLRADAGGLGGGKEAGGAEVPQHVPLLHCSAGAAVRLGRADPAHVFLCHVWSTPKL